MRRGIAFCVAFMCAGCWDFVDPDFPEAGAPAVLQVNASANERGAINITALLAPGLTIGGVHRTVVDDTLSIYGFRLTPTTVRRNGSRDYSLNAQTDDAGLLSRPFTVEPPAVEGLARPPAVQWFGISKIGPDTIAWVPGTPLVLSIDTTVGASEPLPQIRQWFLDLRGADRTFRISSDGMPPPTLRIPSEWVPEAQDSLLPVNLSFYQSGQQLSPPRDYISNVTFIVTLQWIVKVLAS